MEFLEYMTHKSKKFSEELQTLSEGARIAFIKIEGELATDPDKYPSRRIELDENIYIYQHPQPAIELTYRKNPKRKILKFLHIAEIALNVSKELFISYSHKDERWLLELKKWLKPLEQKGIVSIWDDQRIKAGANWRQEIENALSSAKAAVLLISIDFLNSEFITNNELPQLLNAAEEKGLIIFWIAVRESTVDDTEIAKYQAAHKDPPLAMIEEEKREKHYKYIYKKIKEAVEA